MTQHWSGKPREDVDEPLEVSDWNALFPKDHLTAADMWDEVKETYINRDLVVESVGMRNTFDTEKKEKTKKPIMRFKGAKKFMFLNHEISELMQKITGKADPNKWVGWTVNVFVRLQRHTPQGPKDVPRVRPIAGRSGAPQGQTGPKIVESDDAPEQQFDPNSNDDIPF